MCCFTWQWSDNIRIHYTLSSKPEYTDLCKHMDTVSNLSNLILMGNEHNSIYPFLMNIFVWNQMLSYMLSCYCLIIFHENPVFVHPNNRKRANVFNIVLYGVNNMLYLSNLSIHFSETMLDTLCFGKVSIFVFPLEIC